jgi:thioredoxin reductase (NADPH)
MSEDVQEPLGIDSPETPDREGAAPRLDDEQRELFRGIGHVRTVQAGEILYSAGDRGTTFFVIESGSVTIVQGYGEENRVIAVHGAHRFLGELGLLIGQRLYLTGVVREAGEVIEVPMPRLWELVARDKAISDLILSSFMARRAFLVEAGTGIKLIGSRFSPDSRRLREFLARNQMPYVWIDLESDSEAEGLLSSLGVAASETPVVIASGGELLRNPSTAELGEALGLGWRTTPPELCDVVVVGAGPAGISAALYAASEGLDVQAVESVAAGGQAGTSSRIENYMGFPAGVSGSELTERGRMQAAKFGARLTTPAQAVRLRSEPAHHAIDLSNGNTATGRTVVIATGAQYRRLDVPRLADLEGGGVYYAATAAEAQLCGGEPVLVVGGGNAAGQAAMFLSKTSPCRLLIRASDLGRSMSRYLIDQVERNPSIQVCLHTEVVELHGEHELEAITVADNRSGERSRIDSKALFIFIGASPHTEWLDGQLAADKDGFLLTGRDLDGDDLNEFDGERPLFLETSRPGIFAVGDVHSGSIKRVASAVGEGSMAVRLIHQRLAAL